MSTPRRQIVRPEPPPSSPSPQRQRRVQKLRARLEHARSALLRWQSRLRRAFNAFEKHQRQIARLERQITQQEG